MKYLIFAALMAILPAHADVQTKILGSKSILMLLEQQADACTTLLVSKIKENGRADLKSHTLTGTQRVINGKMELVRIEELSLVFEGTKTVRQAICVVGMLDLYLAKIQNKDGSESSFEDGQWVTK